MLELMEVIHKMLWLFQLDVQMLIKSLRKITPNEENFSSNASFKRTNTQSESCMTFSL